MFLFLRYLTSTWWRWSWRAFFLSKWRSARAYRFHSLGQDQSTVTNRAETTVAEWLPDKLRVSSFPDRFPHCTRTAAQSAHSDFVGSRVCACLGVNCYLHFWQNDRGLLRATEVTRGWNGHRIGVSTQNYLWRRKISRRSCRDSDSQKFRSRVRRSTNTLFRLSVAPMANIVSYMNAI